MARPWPVRTGRPGQYPPGMFMNLLSPKCGSVVASMAFRGRGTSRFECAAAGGGSTARAPAITIAFIAAFARQGGGTGMPKETLDPDPSPQSQYN
eukprot:gene120-biopygen927